jgi:hypothetical protein
MSNPDEDIKDPKVLRWAHAIVVVCYTLEGLIKLGILEGPQLLTQDGRVKAEQLLADGFEVTDQETEEVMMYLMGTGQPRTIN